MKGSNAVIVGSLVVVLAVGVTIYSKLDNWFSKGPTGPGSGESEELPLDDNFYHDPDVYMNGPGSGDELRPDPKEWPGPGSGDELPADTPGPGSGDEITFKDSAIGSCNLIDEASTCIEYYGSYWTKDTINLACEEGKYSTKPCPRPSLGGCRMNADSQTDMTTWHYDYGGVPYSQEVAGYASQACNAVPGGVWINSD